MPLLLLYVTLLFVFNASCLNLQDFLTPGINGCNPWLQAVVLRTSLGLKQKNTRKEALCHEPPEDAVSHISILRSGISLAPTESHTQVKYYLNDLTV